MTCGQEFADPPARCPFDGTVLSTIATELSPGTILGDRYEIIGSVAAGGMGKVYKAQHKLMKRLVAIKTIHMSLVSSGSALQRFQQEAQAISALNHPNILTVFDFFIADDGQPYLVMDFLQGTNLQEVLRRRRLLEPAVALPIMIAAASGLAHAHEHGVVHRDIKPSNLMLVDFGGNPDFVKIVDFGIAKLVSQEGESSHLTATGDTFGSPEFMSPEQCRAKKPDARSDIYSLGCVMYNTLTAISAFHSRDPMESMYKQVHETPPLPSSARPEARLPKELDDLILRAMQKDPDDRFQTMEEMRLALEAVQVQFPRQSGSATTTSQRLKVLDTSIPPTFDPSMQSTLSDVTVKTTVGGRINTTPPADTTQPATDSPPTGDILVAPPSPGSAARNQHAAAMSAIAIALVAVIVILVAVGSLKQAVQPVANSNATSGSVAQAPPAVKSTPVVTAPSPAAAPAPSPAPAPAPAPAAQTEVAVATPVLTAPRQLSPVELALQRQKQMETNYKTNLKGGQAAFKAHRYPEAQLYFREAHKAAESFGQRDERYIESLYWIAKTYLATGQNQQAAQSLQWVLFAQKAQYGESSPKVKATERDLEAANKALNH
jgi:serine/threonine-protein kinase